MYPFRSRSFRADEAVPPVGRADGVSAQRAAAMLNLLPIPAAVIAMEDGVARLVAGNAALTAKGLCHVDGPRSLLELLGERVTLFLASGSLHEQFLWQFGEAVDCRHFAITLSRNDAAADRCLVCLIDHTSELQTESNLRRELMTDSLTGLPNRAEFSDRLERLLAQPEQRAEHAILVVDLDRFSRVNACLGALAGDELLITVARRLKGALRSHDVLSRTGGDEFAILLTLEEGHGDAAQVARRIQAALATPFRMADFEIRVACSIGIAFGNGDLDDAEELIRQAQFAVKRAKRSGRAESYQPDAYDRVREAFGLETALRRALERGQLRLNYQPICDLASGELISFEALARWRDDDGHEYSPNDFIPVAEESGLIVPLGRWVIEEAARTLADWDRQLGQPSNVKLAVNVSAIQLQRDKIASLVEHALAANGLSGTRLVLELTESALVADPDRIAGFMHSLKGLGATIALDDFGTGYSNLAYLQKLPIDVLKIDRSFVTGMLADRDKVAIVRAILGLAQALGMKTTAEGVESNELSQTLAALGCSYGQGFLFAPPLEADAAYQMIERRLKS